MRIKLGETVRDEVTGVIGIAVKRIKRSEKIEIQPIVASDEESVDPLLFDEARLKKVGSKRMTFKDFMCHSAFMAVMAGWLVLFGCMWYHDDWQLSEVYAIKLGETIGLSIIFVISVVWFAVKYRERN